MKLLVNIKLKIKFAFWIWPSIIGMFVSLCFLYSVYYLLSAIFPVLNKLTIGNHPSHTQLLLFSAILFVVVVWSVLKPISGGLSAMYIIALISSIVSVIKGNYISIPVWLLFCGFATYSVMRTTPPYYHTVEMKTIEQQFREKKKLENKLKRIKKND